MRNSLLLKAYHYGHAASAAGEAAQGLADDSAARGSPISYSHRITGVRAGCKQIACVNGAEAGIRFHSALYAPRVTTLQ